MWNYQNAAAIIFLAFNLARGHAESRSCKQSLQPRRTQGDLPVMNEDYLVGETVHVLHERQLFQQDRKAETVAPTSKKTKSFRLKTAWKWDGFDGEQCLDLDERAWGRVQHSRQVNIEPCHEGINQRWIWKGTRITSKKDSNRCLGWIIAGYVLELQPCVEGDPNQAWRREGDTIRPHEFSKVVCLGVHGIPHYSNGDYRKFSAAGLRDCDGKDDQLWFKQDKLVEPTPSPAEMLSPAPSPKPMENIDDDDPDDYSNTPGPTTTLPAPPSLTTHPAPKPAPVYSNTPGLTSTLPSASTSTTGALAGTRRRRRGSKVSARRRRRRRGSKVSATAKGTKTTTTTTTTSPLTLFQFKIKLEKHSMCLDWFSKSQDVGVWECHGEDNQRWYWSGSQLRSAKDHNMCLEWDTVDGIHMNVGVSPCRDVASQQWIRDSLSDEIRASTTDESDCLDWDRTNGGKNVILWMCHGGENQQWVQSDPSVEVG